MGTKTHKEINKDDIRKFIAEESDFAFEIRTLQKLRELDYECEHSGTYTDPVTGKTRQFDIRAKRQIGDVLRLHLAVECKNISKIAPLVAHCVPRHKDEAFHCQLRPISSNLHDSVSGMVERREAVLYGFGEKHLVAKSVTPVWEEKENGNKEPLRIVGRDGDLYEKWDQAIASCHDLLRKESYFLLGNTEAHAKIRSLILPMLIVPDSTLWTVAFDENGAADPNPTPAEHASLYVGKTINPWGEKDVVMGLRAYTISHLEIVTVNALAKTLKRAFECFTEKGLFNQNQLS